MTEDELDGEMATMFNAVETTTVKTVNGKPYISDEETLREMEFSAACKAMVEAEQRFQRLSRRAHAQKGVPEDMVDWFDALECRCQTDKKLWELFTAGDASVRSNNMYNEYRQPCCGVRAPSLTRDLTEAEALYFQLSSVSLIDDRIAYGYA